uniref:Uncharacterized protein n=2 Tax=Anguilla anguilla TaxID=7936 RepID=A0A0E9V8I9_ANGAN
MLCLQPASASQIPMYSSDPSHPSLQTQLPYFSCFITLKNLISQQNHFHSLEKLLLCSMASLF